MELRTLKIRVGQMPTHEPTPRERAQMRLILETALRVSSGALLGAPINYERARDEALLGLSDRERALLAKEAEPVTPPFLPIAIDPVMPDDRIDLRDAGGNLVGRVENIGRRAL